MFETDFPRATCLYPDALQYIANAASEFTLEERTKVMGGLQYSGATTTRRELFPSSRP
jgi:hypothetical protein